MSHPKNKVYGDEFNIQLFENLCDIQCTHTEIAACMGVTRQTIYEHVEKIYGKPFAEVYEEFTEKGKMSLRRKQHALAEKSPAMAIFLGKVYLGQREAENSTDEMHAHYKKLCEQLMGQIKELQAQLTSKELPYQHYPDKEKASETEAP